MRLEAEQGYVPGQAADGNVGKQTAHEGELCQVHGKCPRALRTLQDPCRAPQLNALDVTPILIVLGDGGGGGRAARARRRKCAPCLLSGLRQTPASASVPISQTA